MFSAAYRKLGELSTRGYLSADAFIRSHATGIAYASGFLMLGTGLTGLSLAQTTIPINDFRIACSAFRLLALLEGTLGALIMTVAGIATVISAALGAYRAATSLLVVALASFVLRSFVHIFFNIGGTPPGGCDASLLTVP
ncbi:MAG: hypothetical protein KDD44_11400 [Bdellovibrionales bacterium]|nr:hypothetical protein [Bdellovibrionales bacterium]